MIISSQYRQTGYLYNDDRASGGKVTEADLTGCRHCEKIILIQDWKQEGGWCGRCGAPICLECANRMDTEGCVPFTKLIDAALEKQARDRAYRKALGL
jgi:hypothetical protein